jgi:hypothetical protein
MDLAGQVKLTRYLTPFPGIHTRNLFLRQYCTNNFQIFGANIRQDTTTQHVENVVLFYIHACSHSKLFVYKIVFNIDFLQK